MPREQRAPRSLNDAVDPKCGCGSSYPPGKDGACFDCRIEDWTEQQIQDSKLFGPAIIGKAQYEYVQGHLKETNGGIFGPALLGKIVPGNVRTPKDAA